MTCLECGAESAEATDVCARCGAPVGLQQPVAATPALGLPATWIAQAGPRYPRRRTALIAASVGAGVLIALAALIAVIVARHSSTSANQLTWDQMQPGDCLTGSNMGLGNSTPWPDYVTRAACTQPHEAEVFFAGDNWPQSLAYPGKKTIDDQAHARCATAFTGYDGIAYTASAFTFDSIFDDDASDWASGDRSLDCVAYEPSSSGPSGGAPVDYSIKGSNK
jgi:hypothetical protein